MESPGLFLTTRTAPTALLFTQTYMRANLIRDVEPLDMAVQYRHIEVGNARFSASGYTLLHKQRVPVQVQSTLERLQSTEFDYVRTSRNIML